MSLRIAIDGPSGAGKSTLARALAERLDLPYVDTGAMYRAVAYCAMQRGASTATELVQMVDVMDLQLLPAADDFRVLVDGVDVTEHLRQPAVSIRASEVAQVPGVRARLVALQQAAAANGGVVEGRDIGANVLPDADLKLFVTADEAVRMRRRAEQLGVADVTSLKAEIGERDRRDQQRATAPLRRAEGAVKIDTGSERPDVSLQRILDLLESRQKPR